MPNAASAWAGPVWTRNPSRVPNANVMTIPVAIRTTSPVTWPMSGAERAIGSERKRSKTPVAMSVFREVPVAWLPKITLWASTPGGANWR